MRSISIFLILSIFTLPVLGQSWNRVEASSVPERGLRNINPESFITAAVDDEEIRRLLWTAPQELEFDPNRDQHTLINVMLADGSMDEFSIVQYQMMEPGLAKSFDNIRTFHGLSTTVPARRIRINYTVHGLRATITDSEGQTYIDHLQRNDKTHKIIYKRNNLSAHEEWACNFAEEKINFRDEENNGGSRSGDCLFRSYRFAMTTTGEYSNYHGATSEADSNLVMSAVVTTMDRVNDVFEQDLTVRFILIDNNTDIFYYDPATDPFSGSSAGSMISQNQTNTDNVIGSANYDIGHIVSTGGSGLASLGVICANGFKARGVTGISVPEGDPFDIDYVSHEIGHQLGANHTQNNSCNRNNSTAMEPGSASTIMGYAGICSPNVQNNSDAYFHAISIQEMNAEITSSSCHGTISLSNTAPVANSLTNKSIPHSTPFVLDVVATDEDGDVLTYNWEQMDNEVGPVMPPAGTNSQGPMFRSKFATNDSKRYFPNLTAVTTGTSDQWEVLPTVDRNMDFRVTVRDNTFAPGCTDEQDITIDVVGTAGPFEITSQNSATTWSETESVAVTWDVANTNLAPINCSHVDIYLSYDSGLTYSDTLATMALNNGSTNVNVPLGESTTARIMIKCSDNVFYDVNNTDITIESGSPSFSINTNPTSGTTCDDQSLAFSLESASILGFSDPINLAVSNLPPGATATIADNPIDPGDITTITLDNMDGNMGNYSIVVTGVSGAIVRETNFDLMVENADFAPTLSSPANGSTGEITEPIISWNSIPGATSYEYQVSLSAGGGNVVASGSTSGTSTTISPSLELSTLYYWRVRGTNSCGMTPWSNDWTFETGACILVMANDLPISISPNGTPTIVSSLTIPDKGLITDLNIIDLEGNHTYVSDLNFTLIAPDGTEVEFLTDPCNQQNNFDINFDDEAASANFPCPPTNGQSYIPEMPLTPFDTKQIKGQWQMEVFDDYDLDGGALNSWGLELCLDDYCDLTVNNSAFTPVSGTLKAALGCAVSGDTIYLESALAGSMINAGNDAVVIDESIVIVANPNDNIQLISEGNAPIFTINAGKTVTLIGFQIENTDSTSGVIVNNGSLILENMNIISDTGSPSIINQNMGVLTLKGNCMIMEN